MISVNDVALDYLNGHIDVVDLVEDVQFLREVDESILRLMKEEDNWPDLVIAKKRKKLFEKIESLLEEGESDGRIQRSRRGKYKS